MYEFIFDRGRGNSFLCSRDVKNKTGACVWQLKVEERDLIASCERKSVDDRLSAYEARLISAGGPFEMIEAEGKFEFTQKPGTLPEIYSIAERFRGRDFVIGSRTVRTYDTILDDASKLGRYLRIADRVHSGDRVALCVGNPADWILWFMALTTSGACCVLVDSGDEPDIEIDALVADREGFSSVHRNLWFDAAGWRDWTEVATGSDAVAVDPRSDAVILLTSGSTGRPKGVIHTHASLVAGAKTMMMAGAMAKVIAPTANPLASIGAQRFSTLVLAPLTYISGFAAVLLSMLTGGAVAFPEEGYGADDIADQLIAVQATSIAGLTEKLLRQLLLLPQAPGALAHLSRLYIHGGELNPALMSAVERDYPGLSILTGYGLSETAGAVTIGSARDLVLTPGGCGRPLAPVEIRIVRAEGCAAQVDERGQIEIRGPMVAKGYANKPSHENFTADGWFRTGDIGHLDALGWLVLADRASASSDDPFRRAEVERFLKSRLDVDDCALVITADGRWDIFCEREDRRDVHDPALEQVVHAAFPTASSVRIIRVDALPRTRSGKIDRLALGAAK